MAYLKGIGLEESTADFSRRARRGTQLSAMGGIQGLLTVFGLAKPVADPGTVIDPKTGAPVNPATPLKVTATPDGNAVVTSAAPMISPTGMSFVPIAIAAAAGIGLFVYLKRRRK